MKIVIAISLAMFITSAAAAQTETSCKKSSSDEMVCTTKAAPPPSETIIEWLNRTNSERGERRAAERVAAQAEQAQIAAEKRAEERAIAAEKRAANRAAGIPEPPEPTTEEQAVTNIRWCQDNPATDVALRGIGVRSCRSVLDGKILRPQTEEQAVTNVRWCQDHPATNVALQGIGIRSCKSVLDWYVATCKPGSTFSGCRGVVAAQTTVQPVADATSAFRPAVKQNIPQPAVAPVVAVPVAPVIAPVSVAEAARYVLDDKAVREAMEKAERDNPAPPQQ